MSQVKEMESTEGNCFVALTQDHLDIMGMMNRVRSPSAGAITLFAGTTRDNFDGKPVKDLQYTSYEPRAMQTMMAICKEISQKYSLTSIAMIHRLGVVPIGEESILIAVSSPHRQAAWKAGEEALEECKSKVEVWKLEEFGGAEGGVWRANRDGISGSRVAVVKEGEAIPESGANTRPRSLLEHGHVPVVTVGKDGADSIPENSSTTHPRRLLEHGHGPVVPVGKDEADPITENSSTIHPRPLLEHGHGPVIPVGKDEADPITENSSTTHPRPLLEHGHGPVVPVGKDDGDPIPENSSVVHPRPILEHGHGPVVTDGNDGGDSISENSSITHPRPLLEHGHGPVVIDDKDGADPIPENSSTTHPRPLLEHGHGPVVQNN